jgi:hypothetical protein
MLTPRRRHVLIWCAIAFGVACVYLHVFGLATWFVVVKGRNLGGKDSALWKTPVALQDLSISSGRGRKVSYLGYEFDVPWNDLDEQKTRLYKEWQLIAFHSGKSIFFAALPTSASETELSRLNGNETINSNYAFVRAMLETTPGEIGLFTPKGEATRGITRLLLKSTQILANNGESGIFLIQNKNFRGFQYGNPDSRPFEVIDDLFADKGRLHFVFCEVRCGGISQAEINRVIQSVRPVNDQNSAAGQ